MKNNKIDIESVIAIAKKAFDDDATKVQMARDLANDCADITDGDRCEAAIKVFECGHISAKSRGMTFEDV